MTCLRLLASAALLLCLACSSGGENGTTPDTGQPLADVSDSGPMDVVSDVAWVQDKPGLPGPSSYVLAVDVELGPGVSCSETIQGACFGDALCCHYDFVRDLTGLDTKFAFGSTHIAPAVALAMSDTMPLPTFTVITLNFGIIIGTSDKPPSTSSSGEYPFTGFEPEITLTIHNKEFSSKEEGAVGTFNVTDWTAEEGGKWAGSVAGTIVQKTDKAAKLRVQVDGSFEFILPAPAGGQRGG
jgi:hypothetical protein